MAQSVVSRADTPQPDEPRTELERLRAAIAAFSRGAYLLTITGEDRSHCGVVTVTWDGTGEHIVVQAPSRWESSEASGHHHVTLLWPPDEPGGYSLILDGVASTHGAGDESQASDAPPAASVALAISPTRAVLHRRGAPQEGEAAGSTAPCGSDCVPILSQRGAARS